MGFELQEDMEQFLYEEARLLDERRFEDWLELFTDDARYWVPVVSTRSGRQTAMEHGLGYFDDDKGTLVLRVKRLQTEFAFAEEPPSRTVRLISNVQAEPMGDGMVKVYSNFVTFWARLEKETNILAGRREDLLRKVDGRWKIAKRTVYLAENVLSAKNLSIFL